MLVSFLSSLVYKPTRGQTMHSPPTDASYDESSNRRGYYRIRFPAEARPRILLDSGGAVRLVCEVTECSERGIRFLSNTRVLRGNGAAVSGTISFDGGEEVHVSGTVVRVQGDEVVVLLGREGIPLSVVLAEQRRLRARFAGIE